MLSFFGFPWQIGGFFSIVLYLEMLLKIELFDFALWNNGKSKFDLYHHPLAELSISGCGIWLLVLVTIISIITLPSLVA